MEARVMKLKACTVNSALVDQDELKQKRLFQRCFCQRIPISLFEYIIRKPFPLLLLHPVLVCLFYTRRAKEWC